MKKMMTFAAGLLTSLFVANAAAAGNCGYQYCWGAVGFGPGGAYGWAAGYGSQNEAWNRVNAECQGTCTEIKTFYNTCGAIAAGANDGWGWGHAPTQQGAQNIAMNYCNQYDVGCYVRAWACSY